MEQAQTTMTTDTDSTAPMDTTSSVAPTTGTGEQSAQNENQEVYVPFKNGKEKFAVNGQEYEADWDTVKKEYQLARASRMKMEEAASIRKTAESTLKKIYEAAQKDPDGLLGILNPGYRRNSQGAQAATQLEDQGEDPIQSRLSSFEQRVNQAVEERLKPLMEKLEGMDVEKEHKMLVQEYSSVCEKYPAFKNRLEKNYLMNAYNAHLRALGDHDEAMSLEDIAFIVNREIEEERSQQKAAEVQKQKENLRKAPVSARPAAAAEKKGFDSIDDVKRLIGRI